MMYAQWGDQHVIILDPAEIERIKLGDTVRTPNDSVLFAYTPDLIWLASQCDPKTLTPQKLDDLLRIGRARKEVMTIPGGLIDVTKK